MFPPTYNCVGFFFPTLYAVRDIFSLGISLRDYFFPEITHSPPPPPKVKWLAPYIVCYFHCSDSNQLRR